MLIVMVHNEYGKFSGEEAVVQGQKFLLEQHGHEVHLFTRSSVEISSHAFGQLGAFLGGIYNPFVRRRFRKYLEMHRPDIVQIHNLFPLISPSILVECHAQRIPVVMTVHNYRLVCPNGLFMSKGEVCERCAKGREYWCVLKNCENNLMKSLGYALRNYIARAIGFYRNNISQYAALTEFQRNKLIEAGFPAHRISLVPNMVDARTDFINHDGFYVGYLGRISPEKGIETLILASMVCLDIPFKAAGNFERMFEFVEKSPENFEFLGHLSGKSVSAFLADCRFIVLCSTWYEGFPMVLVEGMLAGKPIICSRVGGLPEIVEDGVTGFLFETGNSEDLAEKIRHLWDNPELCLQMGQAARKKALREYSSDRYYERLISIYEKARYE